MYLSRKLSCGSLALLVSASMLTCSACFSQAESTHPYQPIVERNAFALKPIPPPVQPTPVTPPAPQTKVILTGITSIFGPNDKRAFLEITEQAYGKPTVTHKPMLREGERDGSIEVTSIDMENSIVHIKNGTTESDLVFEVAKSSGSAPGAAPVPTAGLPVPQAGAIHPAHAMTTASTEPTIIDRIPSGTPVDRTGINVYGGTPSSTIPTVSTATPLPGGLNYGTASAVPGSTAGNLLTAALNTSRTVRTDTGNRPTAPPVDPVTQYTRMQQTAANAAQLGMPFPPSLPVPGSGNPKVPLMPQAPGQ